MRLCTVSAQDDGHVALIRLVVVPVPKASSACVCGTEVWRWLVRSACSWMVSWTVADILNDNRSFDEDGQHGPAEGAAVGSWMGIL